MNRLTKSIVVAVALGTGSATAEAQFLVPSGPGFGVYSGLGPYGGGYGGGYWGYGPYGGIGNYGGFYNGFDGYGGFGSYGGLYSGYGGYGGFGGIGGVSPFIYSQQLFQQQASLNQQIFQQQQQMMLGQIQEAQGRLEKLDAAKQQLFQQYQAMSDSDKAAVRAGLINDYLNLDAHAKEGWKRDGAIQAIIGPNLKRLDGVAQIRDMSEPERMKYRQGMLQKYRSLSPSEQKAWQSDEIIGMVMGKDWWLK
jgi:hypothetical protein